MAGFRTHITVSTLCGVGFGVAARALGFSPETAFLAAGATAVGGMLPDLDSDSGVPVREMSGLAAAVVPLFLVPRLVTAGMSYDGILAALVGLYLFIRYGMCWLFKTVTVHRGMFHSIPCMVVFGLIVYLEYEGELKNRLLLAGGVMLGFLSHLVLDELWAVNLMGFKVRLNKYAGSALKFFSPSWPATVITYLILAALGLLAWQEVTALRESRHFL